MRSANIIGSGPNGLAAAITLALAGLKVTVYEAAATAGGACSSGELTLPGFIHDLASSAFPMGAASPFLRSLPLADYGFAWAEPEYPCAHPLDGGRAAILTHELAGMAATLGEHDGARWQKLFGPIVKDWQALVPEILGPVLHLPTHPLTLARFGLRALLPAASLARNVFKDEAARALFAGCAVHSVMPLTAPLSASVGLVLAAAGHANGWPVARGGSQALTDALVAHLRTLGGMVHTGCRIDVMSDMPEADLVFFDTSAEALARIAGDRLAPAYRASLGKFRQGPGVFKVDWALSEAIPWAAAECRRAGTVHVGGTLEEMTAAEQSVFDGKLTEKPFVLLVQPTVADPTRAPAGRHTAWGYCHVPNGSTVDQTEAIEAHIERFAPGFRDCILTRHTQNTAQLQAWDANLVGGDLSGGAMTPRQMVMRPTARTYGTGNPGIFLCSSATPPGGGVHGMCGWHAARLALHAG